jgi:hypothetical protein
MSLPTARADADRAHLVAVAHAVTDALRVGAAELQPFAERVRGRLGSARAEPFLGRQTPSAAPLNPLLPGRFGRG